ncbi:hypothetical protein EMIHUDRAFT_208963 [Emiliania huxleyi CCMP1516]|uniref:Fibronectin type-III domain-containing protein n=2 Tax=Emiliania huxleyi TaxID=2903 RepID=A0A0D3J7F0_EMIH1|nr:hypothetical protein EMIHUDRAFT_208963 [Emiliania huxleyi CCMP1516]EOD19435.1 hypothetical protein EMIHUDRAFT_208963 [Emiliania huxleyi CCMP1516]|eukprot:XP_005771864.1 hypothetical protein EMIHUDRAFT_208963 [Emiliania huxleyi CCMP1516]
MDAVEGKECTAEGDGLTGFTAQQVPTSFTIVAAGSGGARLTTGGGSFKVSVRGQAAVKEQIADNGDGTYTVSLTYPQSGRYEVSISHKHAPIRGSPFTVQVHAARRPPAPPPPRLSADRLRLEWDAPSHTGGTPIKTYRVRAMARSLGGGDPTLVSELTGDVLSCEVPERFRGADRASALYHAFTVSAENSKGESDQSEPGPQPRLFDRARIEAERDAMEALHNSLASNGPVPIGALVSAVGEDTAVRSAAAAAPSAPEVAASVMGRLRAAAAMTDEAEAVLAHQGDGMGAVAEEASMALSSADLTAAMEQAEAVARLLHVWDVATEADGGGCITCAEYAASAAADPAIGRALAALPTLRVAIDQLTQSHAGDLAVREAARLKDKATAEAESEAAMSAAVSRWAEEDAALDAEHRARAEEVEARVSAAKAETEARIGEADAQALR